MSGGPTVVRAPILRRLVIALLALHLLLLSAGFGFTAVLSLRDGRPLLAILTGAAAVAAMAAGPVVAGALLRDRIELREGGLLIRYGFFRSRSVACDEVARVRRSRMDEGAVFSLWTMLTRPLRSGTHLWAVVELADGSAIHLRGLYAPVDQAIPTSGTVAPETELMRLDRIVAMLDDHCAVPKADGV